MWSATRALPPRLLAVKVWPGGTSSPAALEARAVRADGSLIEHFTIER